MDIINNKKDNERIKEAKCTIYSYGTKISVVSKFKQHEWFIRIDEIYIIFFHLNL